MTVEIHISETGLIKESKGKEKTKAKTDKVTERKSQKQRARGDEREI